jgi:hypothetical protein
LTGKNNQKINSLNKKSIIMTPTNVLNDLHSLTTDKVLSEATFYHYLSEFLKKGLL